MWAREHTVPLLPDILGAIEHLIETAMKNACTKSLVILVVAVATVRSYVTLALQTRVLPRHIA